MAQMEFLIVINFAAGMTVFLFACDEIAEKQRPLTSPSAWIYTALVLASLFVMGHSLVTGRPHHPSEVFFNVAVAMHLARKMWQGRQKRCATKAAQAQAEAEPKTETVNSEKENQNGNNSIKIERRTASANAGKRCGKQHRKQHGSRGKHGNGRNRRRH